MLCNDVKSQSIHQKEERTSAKIIADTFMCDKEGGGIGCFKYKFKEEKFYEIT